MGWERVEGLGGSEGAWEVDVEVAVVGVELVCGFTPNDDVAPAAVEIVSDRMFRNSLEAFVVLSRVSQSRLTRAPTGCAGSGSLPRLRWRN